APQAQRQDAAPLSRGDREDLQTLTVRRERRQSSSPTSNASASWPRCDALSPALQQLSGSPVPPSGQQTPSPGGPAGVQVKPSGQKSLTPTKQYSVHRLSVPLEAHSSVVHSWLISQVSPRLRSGVGQVQAPW